ncbi:MAG: 3-dehydroquinate synthase [Desulfamplus sp.]|nr:3-dehydroquinate synthase [Desulfamplus sp.]
MKTIKVNGSQGVSNIYVGESINNVCKYLPQGRQCVVITDSNVKRYYEQYFPSGSPVITISTGEEIKTLATVEIIIKELIELSADRSTFILGIGGGIVCDITGFVASIYMRGVDFAFVSTTLLSQVDASVGGKNGVNFDSYKNMVGLFCQPKFVICDPTLLKTLPNEEISNGFAEIVKHALIADAKMLNYIESNIDRALTLDSDVISNLVEESVRLKASVVERDEKEAGERKKLNFGHTLGHALEKLKPIGHGRAVSIGMAAAALFSLKKGLLNQSEVNRIKIALKSLHLPVDFKEFGDNTNIIFDELLSAMSKDKKKDNDKISFVFLNGIGNAVVEKITFEELKSLLLNL